jgi:hypothetical protein
MADSRKLQTTKEALEAIRSYMYNFYPERKENDPFPLEFWKLNDDLFYDYMNYLPCVLSVKFNGMTHEILRQLPEAFHILWPIFGLEEGYDCDGWTALANAGVEELPLAITAYERIGMPGEAKALQAALTSCSLAPDDTDAAEAAYKSVTREYEDDDERRIAVITYMRNNEHLWEQYLE